MSRKAVSQSWYRVSGLKPRLAAQARLHRQVFRGRPSYVLQDLVNQRFFRLGTGAWRFVGLLDGRRTVHEVWDTLNAQLGDDAPTQDELIALLSQLHGGNVLLCDLPPDTAEMFARYRKAKGERLKQYLTNPLFVRIPLFDPDRFLARWAPYVRHLFSWWGAAVWLSVVLGAAGVVMARWGDLTAGVTDRILAPDNLIWLWLTFAVIKGIHEFGHGFACRSRGGEVHEMGIMFLIFMPVPYVEASSSWAFPRTRSRLLVSAGGIIAEIFVASVATFVWAWTEPGLVNTLAYNAMFIASVSTILFNANPLLRYDGYYILSDLIEIPNLRGKSQQYIYYLIKRYLFGLEQETSPAETARERAWFFSYGIASTVYKVFITVAILFYVAGKFFAVGVILALVSALTWGLVPLVKACRYLFSDPRLHQVRTRALLVTGAIVGGAIFIVSLVPVPLGRRAEGLLFLPDQAVVRAEAPGFVETLPTASGTAVRRGDPLLVCSNPELENDLKQVELRLVETRLRRNQQVSHDQVLVGIFNEQIALLEEQRAHFRKQVDDLVLRSPVDGVYYAPMEQDMPGRYLAEGAAVGQVIDPDHIVVRALVPQNDVELIRDRMKGVEVRLAEDIGAVIPAEIEREVPAGSEYLPSAALGSLGGGQVLVDPRDPSGALAIQPHFMLDLRLPPERVPIHSGGRAFVRFDLGWEPLLLQWGRRVRQLLMDRFDL